MQGHTLTFQDHNGIIFYSNPYNELQSVNTFQEIMPFVYQTHTDTGYVMQKYECFS
ncbi:8241_t:CDS:2 [Racocetra fulgida]|uniref:8241_t:CDS:1 n=1 Tax=Racocetra fulgida TaxID=60492 RepID=A0A9N9F555_9GLOM|nr:8241_t:CDS:2 [Racocetra fulgida]